MENSLHSVNLDIPCFVWLVLQYQKYEQDFEDEIKRFKNSSTFNYIIVNRISQWAKSDEIKYKIEGSINKILKKIVEKIHLLLH